MKISDFFTDILGANLRNKRWSWGAIDPITNRVFLRVWKDGIQMKGDQERIRIIVDVERSTSRGYIERRKHVQLIQNGAEGFGVVCTTLDPNAKERSIKSFDHTTLLRFGNLVKEGKDTFAEIDGHIPVSLIQRQRTAESTLSEDLQALIKQKKDSTQREELINARIGQGTFRMQVLKLWGYRCSVTNSETIDAIRASHIKPWHISTNEERLDPYNGFPLIASLDALFDAGLISFDSSGKLLISCMLKDNEQEIFGIKQASLKRTPTQKTAEYLTYHRTYIFKD
jgi:putative restriction endonuclease